MKIIHVVGARPNFVKIAPIIRALSARGCGFEQILVHTGQHYDDKMSTIFFQDLNIPEVDENLNVGSGSHARQTAEIMMRFENVLQDRQPDWVVVVGDVNSTLACSLVCAKLAVPVAHVEAGLRSGDRAMPEEINRIVTDHVSDLLFTSSPEAEANLALEGIPGSRVHHAGNVMIATLVDMLPRARASDVKARLGLNEQDFLLATIHRPGNVDDPGRLCQILCALEELARQCAVVLPLHPRTRTRIVQVANRFLESRVLCCDPLGYIDFLCLTDSARLVITDSGGLQEETSFLGVPCLTVRPNTERRITVTHGTNRLVEACCQSILTAAANGLENDCRRPCLIDGWDGSAAERIANVFSHIREAGGPLSRKNR